MELDTRIQVLPREGMINGVQLICFYGPESTGKTVLAKRLARHFATTYVPEVARELISNNNFTTDDILRIGRAQTARVFEKSLMANKVLFCDTDLITTQIYSCHYLQDVPAELFILEKQVEYDHYFLFDIDVPWVADGLRDLKDQRHAMFQVFKRELDKRKVPYTIVQGTYAEREKFLIDQVRTTFLGLPT